MYGKPQKYIAKAKEFIGRSWGQGKMLAAKIDGYIHKGYDAYRRTVPVLQALSDVSGVGGGHMKQMKRNVYQGAKEYERLRNEITNRGATVEQAMSKVGGAVDSSFASFY